MISTMQGHAASEAPDPTAGFERALARTGRLPHAARLLGGLVVADLLVRLWIVPLGAPGPASLGTLFSLAAGPLMLLVPAAVYARWPDAARTRRVLLAGALLGAAAELFALLWLFVGTAVYAHARSPAAATALEPDSVVVELTLVVTGVAGTGLVAAALLRGVGSWALEAARRPITAIAIAGGAIALGQMAAALLGPASRAPGPGSGTGLAPWTPALAVGLGALAWAAVAAAGLAGRASTREPVWTLVLLAACARLGIHAIGIATEAIGVQVPLVAALAFVAAVFGVAAPTLLAVAFARAPEGFAARRPSSA